jgi:flagellar biosynthesis chaperone FliJ
MALKSEREMLNSKHKLKKLEQAYDETQQDNALDPGVRAVSLRSLKRLINQLTEEIARYEAHHAVR